MNHLKWNGHMSTMMEIPKVLYSDSQSCDVTLVGNGHMVKAHRFMLMLCSNMLRRLMADVPIGNECTIILPDVNGKILENVLAFIYLGETCLNSAILCEFLETINVLGITISINFQCSMSCFAQTLTMNDDIHSASNTLQKMVGNNSLITVSAADIIANDGIINGKLTIANVIPNANAESNNANTASNVVNATSATELNFLDEYAEQHQRVTYSIETVPDANNGNEYILMQTAGGYTLEQNTKMEANASLADRYGDVNEEDGIETDILEDYTTAEDPLLNINENASEIQISTSQYISSNDIEQTHSAASIIHNEVHIKSKELKNRSDITRIMKNSQETAPHHPTSILDENASATAATAAAAVVHHNHQGFNVLKVNAANGVVMDFDETVEQIEIINNATSNVTPSGSVESGITDDQKYGRALTEAQNNPIELACQAVIDEGLSLQKAALKYKVSKTVLWRRVRKNPNYMKTTRENPVFVRAYERLKAGESLKSISQDLDIPMSTLHRHKVRLSREGKLPGFVKCRQRDSSSKDNLKLRLAKALHACIHEGMSQNHAAHVYDLSKSTLWRHLHKRIAASEVVDIDIQAVEAIEEHNIKEEIIIP